MSTHYTDINHALVERCRQNDRKAQFELYQKYNQAMFNITKRMCRNEEDAKDVLQDAFVSAFKNIEQFSHKVTFGAWLKRIVINKCLDHLKKRKLNLVDIEHVDYKISDESKDEVFYRVAPALIHEKIKELPTGCRVVFSLYMLEGYDHKEIAQILGVSESTSKSQFGRAKKLLRQKLTPK